MPCVIECHLPPRPKIEPCFTHCFPPFFILPLPLPPPPPPPPPPVHNRQGNTLLLLSLIATATLVGAVFMLCLLFKKLSESRRDSRLSRPALFHVREQSFSDRDDQGPISDHHFWHINTVGFQQSVIDSIAMFKYRKEEKLIDGSDCSICLGEFQDDESLRLLPKCSHAYHVTCIDTWLRSHRNCPICRAPVMSDPAVEPVAGPPPPVETEEQNRACERENSETLNQNEGRSVSMDLVSAVREEGSSSSSSSSSMAISTSKNMEFQIEKMGIGSQGLSNLVKSISIGRSLTKGAISMKRFSSGRRKLKGFRHYRSQSSVLPL